MPVYSFECGHCGNKEDIYKRVEERGEPVTCPCSYGMNRIPELFTANTFEPYYDEGLGSDVYSTRDRKAIMSDLDLIEAGDPVHGARILDDKNPNLMKKQPPKGKRKNMPKAFDDAVIEVSDAKGDTISREFSGNIAGYD